MVDPKIHDINSAVKVQLVNQAGVTTPIMLPTGDVLKSAAIAAITGLPMSPETESFCLYVLRAVKTPAIVQSDVEYLDAIDNQLRSRRMSELEFRRYARLALVGLASAAITYVTTVVSGLL